MYNLWSLSSNTNIQVLYFVQYYILVAVLSANIVFLGMSAL